LQQGFITSVLVESSIEESQYLVKMTTYWKAALLNTLSSPPSVIVGLQGSMWKGYG